MTTSMIIALMLLGFAMLISWAIVITTEGVGDEAYGVRALFGFFVLILGLIIGSIFTTGSMRDQIIEHEAGEYFINDGAKDFRWISPVIEEEAK